MSNNVKHQSDVIPFPEAPTPAWVDRAMALLESFHQRLDRMERFFTNSVVKETYTVEEAAERLGRRPWTVRQWCNKGQVRGARKVHGKGRTGEWRIPHDEVVRLQNEGPSRAGSCPAA